MKTAQWKTGFQALNSLLSPSCLTRRRLPGALSPAVLLQKSNEMAASLVRQAEFGVLTKISDHTVIHLKVVTGARIPSKEVIDCGFCATRVLNPFKTVADSAQIGSSVIPSSWAKNRPK
jgi:hypothetical protein